MMSKGFPLLFPKFCMMHSIHIWSSWDFKCVWKKCVFIKRIMLPNLFNSLVTTHLISNHGICACQERRKLIHVSETCDLTASLYFIKKKQGCYLWIKCSVNNVFIVNSDIFTCQQLGSSAYLCSANVFMRIL